MLMQRAAAYLFSTEQHDLFLRLHAHATRCVVPVQHRTARTLCPPLADRTPASLPRSAPNGTTFFSAYVLMQRAAEYLFSTEQHEPFVRLWLTARSHRRSVQPGRLRPIAWLAVGGPLPKPDEAKADLARSKCLPSKHSRSVGWSGTSRRQASRVPGAPEQTGDPT
jgi:hypothetical protein